MDQSSFHTSEPLYPQQKKHSSKPLIAGSLLIIIGIIGIIFSAVVIGGGFILDNIEDIPFEGYSVTSIRGTIYDPQGNPVDNVTIRINDSHLETKTNIVGQYQIYGIPSGYHQIIIEKNGYNTIMYNTYIMTNDDFSNFVTANNEGTNGSVIFENDDFDFQISPGVETYIYGSERPPHVAFLGQLGGFISGFGVITLFCSILSILGGYFSLQRRKYIFVLLSSIAAIFSFGFLIGSLLAIIALIIIILSSSEFNGHMKQTTMY